MVSFHEFIRSEVSDIISQVRCIDDLLVFLRSLLLQEEVNSIIINMKAIATRKGFSILIGLISGNNIIFFQVPLKYYNLLFNRLLNLISGVGMHHAAYKTRIRLCFCTLALRPYALPLHPFIHESSYPPFPFFIPVMYESRTRAIGRIDTATIATIWYPLCLIHIYQWKLRK